MFLYYSTQRAVPKSASLMFSIIARSWAIAADDKADMNDEDGSIDGLGVGSSSGRDLNRKLSGLMSAWMILQVRS